MVMRLEYEMDFGYRILEKRIATDDNVDACGFGLLALLPSLSAIQTFTLPSHVDDFSKSESVDEDDAGYVASLRSLVNRV